jgi:hypothetical protein
MIAAINSEVAIGRRMKSRDGFTRASPSMPRKSAIYF